jgi:hypothetical protein
MTSQINYQSINEDFPVAGQDNDTQTFRDNFSSIRNNFLAAQEEITDLQNNAARLNESNNFGNNDLSGAVFVNNMDKKFDGGIISSGTSTVTMDYENGNYQIFRFSASNNIEFQNLPENANPALAMGVGKITLELYGSIDSGTGLGRTLTFLSTNGSTFKKSANWPASIVVSSETNPIIIEVWRHNQTNIFMNYLGLFS